MAPGPGSSGTVSEKQFFEMLYSNLSQTEDRCGILNVKYLRDRKRVLFLHKAMFIKISLEHRNASGLIVKDFEIQMELLLSVALQQLFRTFMPSLPQDSLPEALLSPEMCISVKKEDIFVLAKKMNKQLEVCVKNERVQQKYRLPQRMQNRVGILSPTPQYQCSTPVLEEEHTRLLINQFQTRTPKITDSDRLLEIESTSSMVPTLPYDKRVMGIHRFAPYSLKPEEREKLHYHLAKKDKEIKFDMLPSMVNASTEMTLRTLRTTYSLPKLICCGAKCPRLRSKFLLYMEQSALACITNNIKFKYLTFLKGLPTYYTESLTKLTFTQKLHLHLAKKCLELKLRAMPRMVEYSQQTSYHTMTRSLPKWVFPSRAPILRLNVPPFMKKSAVENIQVNIAYKHLVCLWGLPTLYTESLASMMPRALALPSSVTTKASRTECSVRGKPSVKQKIRKSLKQRLQRQELLREGGLPSAVPESRKLFVLSLPVSPKSEREEKKEAALGGSLTDGMTIISKEAIERLDFHVRTQIQQQSGCPLRKDRWKRFVPPPFSASDALPRPHVKKGGIIRCVLQEKKCVGAQDLPRREGTEMLNPKLRREAASCLSSFPNSMTGQVTHYQEHLLLVHLTKKSIENEMKMIPLPVKKSSKMVFPFKKYFLPKEILPGHSYNKLRVRFLPFMERNVVDQIQLNVKHKHFTFLWGIPTLYTESMQSVIPKSPPLLFPVRAKEAVIEITGEPTSFLSSPIRKSLELHVMRKRLRHKWTLPVFIQKSLSAFMPPFPVRAQLKKKPRSENTVLIIREDAPFVDKDLLKHFEYDLKRKIIHQKFGLPKKIIASLRMFASRPPPETDLTFPKHGSKENKALLVRPSQRSLQLSSRTLRTQAKTLYFGISTRISPQPVYVHNNLRGKEKKSLEVHLAKKNLELKLDVIPPLVKTSHKYANLEEKGFLPKTICSNDQMTVPIKRDFPYMGQNEINMIEMNLKQKHLKFCWGLPTQYATSLRKIIPEALTLFPSIKVSGSEIDFMDPETCCVEPTVRESLEWHIGKKSLQTEQGLPIMLQKSLLVFRPPPPQLINVKESEIKVLPLVNEMCFVRENTLNLLESHMRNMILQKQSEPPLEVLDSMRRFIPLTPPINKQNSDIELKMTNSVCFLLCRTGFPGVSESPASVQSEENRTETKPLHFQHSQELLKSLKSVRQCGLQLKNVIKLNSNISLENEDISVCQMSKHKRSPSTKANGKHSKTEPVKLYTQNKIQIIHDLDIKFKELVLTKNMGTPYPSPEIPSTLFSIPSYLPCIKRETAKYVVPQPIQCPDLRNLESGNTNRLEIHVKNNFQLHNRPHRIRKTAETNLSALHVDEVQSHDGTKHVAWKSLDAAIPFIQGSVITESVYTYPRKLKERLQKHLKKKIIMDRLLKPLCVLESCNIYQQMLTQRARDHACRVRKKLRHKIQGKLIDGAEPINKTQEERKIREASEKELPNIKPKKGEGPEIQPFSSMIQKPFHKKYHSLSMVLKYGTMKPKYESSNKVSQTLDHSSHGQYKLKNHQEEVTCEGPKEQAIKQMAEHKRKSQGSKNKEITLYPQSPFAESSRQKKDKETTVLCPETESIKSKNALSRTMLIKDRNRKSKAKTVQAWSKPEDHITSRSNSADSKGKLDTLTRTVMVLQKLITSFKQPLSKLLKENK
ncbi:uncharacterized protein LOC115088256 [Rhinatrema bivittatum]|uniref:uncharacterized protein LOC115088256 n=1 Tax=Rhinatrema bivittatum TaxID=194408 RepID=UPI001128C5EB|nr:uncharacterized protein LOC115088256 [Rhinatrema bivittatum]